MLKGTPIELPDMLAAREARAARQATMHEAYPSCALLSFCLNIPGPIKTNAALRQLFTDGLAAIHECLIKIAVPVRAAQETHANTGDEALLALEGDATAIKEAMTALEDTHPLGRLFDLDVLTPDGHKLSRPTPRRCLICGEQAQICARSRKHSVEELTERIEEMLREYYG